MQEAKEIKRAKEEFLVFRNGKWVEYKKEDEEYSNWTTTQKWEYVGAYGTAISKGYNEEKSKILAEMYIFKQKFSNLLYSSDLEIEYKKLFF